jgi:hypothetical protein
MRERVSGGASCGIEHGWSGTRCRDPRSLHRTIEVEAVLSETAGAEHVEKLWASFRQMSGAFVKGLREYPGLPMSIKPCVDGQRVQAHVELEASTVVHLKTAVWEVAAAGRDVGLVQASHDRAGSFTDDRRRLGRNVMAADVKSICFVEHPGLLSA